METSTRRSRKVIAASMVAAMADAVSAPPPAKVKDALESPEPTPATPLSPEELRDRLKEHFKLSPEDQVVFETLPERYQTSTEQRQWCIQCACGIRSEHVYGTMGRAAVKAIRLCGFKVIGNHLFCRKCARDEKRRARYTKGPVQATRREVAPQRQMESLV